jgi:HK97 gp10 family phage protein
MTKVKIVVTGSEVINERLAKLTNKQAKDAIRKASRTALRPLLERCKSTCPVRNGKMRQSIKIRSITRSRRFVGTRITVGDKDKAYVGKQFYASFIVFGWKTGSRRRTREAAARLVARDLRRQSRVAGALGKRGTDWRARQEAYFVREGARQASKMKVPIRRQIPPNKFMQDAVDALEDHVRTTYYREIGLIIEKQASGK